MTLASMAPATRRPTLRHYAASRVLPISPEALFVRLDNQTRLAEHMAKPSAMMGGGRMTYAFDEGRGMAVGSRIRMGGTAFGLSLSVEEEVIAREPPRCKIWATRGAPRLLIIGGYEMGFEIAPDSEGARLSIWIDYALPERWFGRLLGWLFAALYARWCVDRMIKDAERGSALPRHGHARGLT